MRATRIVGTPFYRALHKCTLGDGCWEWTASLNTAGYGQLMVNRVPRTAHRVMYEALVGPVPEGLELDHLCRNRKCCNPVHLEAVTHHVNVRRGGRAISTHCVNGHEWTEDNIYWYQPKDRPQARRQCKTCGNDRNRVRRAR